MCIIKSKIIMAKTVIVAFTLLLMPNVVIAERVTQITLEDVGSGGLNAFSPTLDNVVAAFLFSPIDDSATVPSDPQITPIDNGPIDIPCYAITIRAPDGSPIPGPHCFNGDIGPIDTSVASPFGFTNFTEAFLQTGGLTEADAFTNGFRFSNTAFQPNTLGPVNLDISGTPPTLAPLANPETDFPFAGVFGDNPTLVPGQAALFKLWPQTIGGDPLVDGCAQEPLNPHLPFTVYWLNRIGETDTYQYKVGWTHCITKLENDENQAASDAVGGSYGRFDQRANWRLEGIMTTEDTVAPLIVSTSPVGGATGVASTSLVSVTFNEPMDPASVTLTSFIVGLTASPTVTECASITASNSNKTFTCTPIGGEFTNSSNFTMTLATTITDDASAVFGGGTTTNALAASAVTTFDIATSDIAPPSQLNNIPGDGATGVLVSASIDVVFDEVMDTAVTAAAISLTANGATVSTNVASTDGITFTITPTANLNYNTVHTINIDPSAQDLSGNLLTAYTPTTFTTETTNSITFNGATVSLGAGSAASLVSIDVLALSEITATQPANFDLANELFVTYTINGVVGGQETVTVTFPTPITDKEVLKVIGGQFIQLVEGNAIGEYQVVSSDTITMTILDNDGTNGATATQDSDPTAGIITDPIVPALVAIRPRPAPLSGGCSLTNGNVSPLDKIDMLLLIGLILWYGIARRKSF